MTRSPPNNAMDKKQVVEKFVEKGVLSPLQTRRNFTPQETLELQEMQRAVNAKKFEAAQIKGNTALVPNGQRVAEESDAVARLLENVKNQYVSQKLVECGYPNDTKCSINLTDGTIVVNDTPPK